MKITPSLLLWGLLSLGLIAGAGAQQSDPASTTVPDAEGGKVPVLDQAAPGDLYAFEANWQVEVDAHSSMNDEPAHTDHLVRSSRTRYAARVLGTDGPLPAAVRRYYAIARSYSRLPGGADRIASSSLQGKTVALRRIGDQILVSVHHGKLDLRDRTRLTRELSDPRDPVLPDREVAVGESWSVDPSGVGKYFPGAMRADMHVTLQDVKPVAGRRCALLRLAVELESKFGGLPMKAQLQGQLAYALDLGRPLSLELRGPVRVDWEKTAGGRTIHVTGEGTAVVEQGYEWRKIAGDRVEPVGH